MTDASRSHASLDITVLVADSDGFRSGYVMNALAAAGATIIGPVTTISQVRCHLEGVILPHAVLVADDLPEADSLALVELLREQGIPHLLLVGASGNPRLYPKDTPKLRAPFASYQVVDWAIHTFVR